jgi:hypothetical protein
MPSSSKKQSDFMRAVAKNPSFAKKVGVSQSVGQDFSSADKGRKFAKGGDMKKGYADGGMTMVNKGGKMVPSFAADGIGKMAKGGMAHKDVKMDKANMQKAVNKHEGRLHKGQPMTKLAKGGTSTKFKRYAEGGEVEEAAAKQRGLDMSNKEAPVGFFERIRMGNIDQPGTEAYNRFGAGRGRDRGESVSVNQPSAPSAAPSAPSMPAASSRPLSDDMYSDYGSSTGAGAAGTSETVKPTRPAATAKPPAKPPAPMKTVGTGNQRGPTAEELAAYSAQKNKKPSAAEKMDVPGMKADAKKALDDDPSAILGAAGAAGAGYGLYKLAKKMMGATKAGKVAAPFLKEIGTNAPKKLLEGPRAASKSADVTDVVPKSTEMKRLGKPSLKKPLDESDTTGGAIGYKRGGKTMKFASGGMVSSVSKRADGIATKGKTRCKIC